MKTVGSYEAKTHFAQILNEVEAGTVYTITRHGRPIARVVGIKQVDDPAAVAGEFAAFRKGRRLGYDVSEAASVGRR